ncbi:MAG: hypothetical protein ACTHJR_12245 [Sphingomonas sp.]|uniref:hypothetical protein n=1 Tax=Sphingomonas sp. TaxID=28214 RepID=UPI003F7D24EE
MRWEERNRWALALGLGALAAIGAGTVAGQQVVDSLNPFYVHQAAADDAGPEIVATSFTAPAEPSIGTGDLSYGRGESAGDDGSGQMR